MTETGSNPEPLYAQNPRQRFSNRAGDYAKYRPSYPSAAIDAMLAGLGAPERLIAADIGAGTGISSRLLADRQVKVLALEPNAAMRAAAEPHPLLEFREAIAEATGLPDQSVDLVVCCQSFHWFDPEVTLPEFHRILKPTGRVALMWNDRNLDDPFTAAYNDLVQAASGRKYFHREHQDAWQPLANSPLFQNFQHRAFENHKALDLTGLIGLAQSKSYVPKQGDEHEQLLMRLRALYAQWVVRLSDAKGDRASSHSSDAAVVMAYVTNLYWAEPNEGET